MAPPKSNVEAMGGLIVPAPRNTRQTTQQQSIRDAQILPDDYYPKGYQPELLKEWPTDKPVFIPKDKVPPGLILQERNQDAATQPENTGQ